jgi:hypothetical protein
VITDDIILHIFWFVAQGLPEIPKHSQAKFYPSELLTIGLTKRKLLSSFLPLVET